MERTEERCFKQDLDKKLIIKRPELEDWQIEFDFNGREINIVSSYKLLPVGETQIYKSHQYFRRSGSDEETRNVSYFLIQSTIFLRFSKRREENSWVFYPTAQGVKIENIPDPCYLAILKQNVIDMAFEKTINQELTRLKISLQECTDTMAYNKLSLLRSAKNTDFVIESSDGGSVSVHKLVMTTYWPFFRTMMENTCKEAVEDTLKMEYPFDVVEMLVSFLYGESFESDFNQSIALLELAGVYLLPALADASFQKIKRSDTPLELHDCVNGWKSARMGQHEEAKTFFTKLIIAKTKPMLKEKSEEAEFKAVTSDETMELLFDCLSVD